MRGSENTEAHLHRIIELLGYCSAAGISVVGKVGLSLLRSLLPSHRRSRDRIRKLYSGVFDAARKIADSKLLFLLGRDPLPIPNMSKPRHMLHKMSRF